MAMSAAGLPDPQASPKRALQSLLALAVSDDLIKKSSARADTVTKPRARIGPKAIAWSDDRVEAVIDAHPEDQRLIAVLMAGSGLRIAEALAISIDEFDFVHHVLHVRRQLKKLGTEHVWALPKNDLERDVPLASWVEDAVLAFISKYPPRPLSLAWEQVDGEQQPYKILFRWPTDDSVIRYRLYSELTWKPPLQLPPSSRRPSVTAAAVGGTSPPARRARISCGTSSPRSCWPTGWASTSWPST